jgi:hypothetical protein
LTRFDKEVITRVTGKETTMYIRKFVKWSFLVMAFMAYKNIEARSPGATEVSAESSYRIGNLR